MGVYVVQNKWDRCAEIEKQMELILKNKNYIFSYNIFGYYNVLAQYLVQTTQESRCREVILKLKEYDQGHDWRRIEAILSMKLGDYRDALNKFDEYEKVCSKSCHNA